jgi:glycosyltransferase involved in cell wall biosynthesis
MKIGFFIPPPAQRRGGIELAINGIKAALGGRHEIVSKVQGKPDRDTQLVHFHGLWQANHLSAYRFCKRHSIPYIISPHGMLEPWAYRNRRWKKWPWLKLFGQGQLDRASCVLATSQMEVGNLRAFARNVEIAPLGLSEDLPLTRSAARERLGVSPDDKIVLYLSRIDRKKGLDLLIAAMADHPDFQLWVAGDGDPEFTRELKNMPNKDVRWIAPKWGSDRWQYLLAADLFCLPTHSENFGFAILESLWAGTPVLTTTKTPWVEHRDVEGLHICEDNLSSLKAALEDILQELKRPDNLGHWARANFHWDNLADTYEQIYHAAANR